MIRPLIVVILSASTVSLLTAAPSFAEEADVRRCLSTRAMQKTYVLDDLNILFVKSKKRIYLNVLPSRCPGLGTYGSFSYSTTTGSLCSSDPIQVMSQGGHDSRICRLGEFRRVTTAEVAAIVKGPDKLPSYDPPPSAEPEDVIEEIDDSEESAQEE